eukprot:scaffold88901_cov66-Attheya_sp.AAC.2
MAKKETIPKVDIVDATTREHNIDTTTKNHTLPKTQVKGTFYNVTETAKLQIENYRRATGLMLNVHITHHGGTTFCGAIGHAKDTNSKISSASCMGVKEEYGIANMSLN